MKKGGIMIILGIVFISFGIVVVFANLKERGSLLKEKIFGSMIGTAFVAAGVLISALAF